VFARDTLAYVSTLSNGFRVLNVANPQNIVELGGIPSLSDKNDVYVTSFFAYLPDFTVIDVSIPSSPAVVGQYATEGFQRGVWVRDPFSWAYVADHFDGLLAVRIADPVHPTLDTMMLGADEAVDLWLTAGYAFIADNNAGLRILDASNPTVPTEIGAYDSIGGHVPFLFWAVAASDSFAFVGHNQLRSVDVSDPARPRLAGIAPITNAARDMVIRDSLLYVAEDYWFQIYSIADPRSPRLVGSCQLAHAGSSLWLADTLAYAAMCIVNVRDPAAPYVVGEFGNWPLGVCVKDTFAYLAINYGGLEVWNVARPATPTLVDTIYLERGYDVLVADSLAYFGGLDFRVLSLHDPTHPVQVGFYSTPYRVRRLYYAPPHIYAACFGGGLCILETTHLTGVGENASKTNPLPELTVWPNPTRGVIRVSAGFSPAGLDRIELYDKSGRKLADHGHITETEGRDHHRQMDISCLPDGCYFLRAEAGGRSVLSKVVKTGGNQ